MDTRLAVALERTHGTTTSTALLAQGVSSREITAAVRSGQLVRVRRGAFVDGDLWRSATPWDRHGLRALAVYRSRPDDVSALSHHSALAIRLIAVHGVDDRVHLVHTDGRRGRTDAVLRVHRQVPAELIEVHRSVRTVTPATACLQVAVQFGAEAGLVSADNALHRAVMTREDLVGAMTLLRPDRWSREPARVVALADPRIESAAESRARWAFHLAGIPQPTPQVELRDERGEVWARLDFLMELEGVIIEVDGMGKYQDARALRAEKVREDRLRELGYEVVRLVWADLSDPMVVLRKVTAAVDRARRRRSVPGLTSLVPPV